MQRPSSRRRHEHANNDIAAQQFRRRAEPSQLPTSRTATPLHSISQSAACNIPTTELLLQREAYRLSYPARWGFHPMDDLRRIIDHLQPKLAGDARHDMEALDHRSCSWLWFSNHRGRRKRCTRFQISCCGRTGFRERRVSTSIPLPRSAGIRLPGVQFSAQVDRVRQSQHVFDGIAGVVGSHEPTGSWWATRLGPCAFSHSRSPGGRTMSAA